MFAVVQLGSLQYKISEGDIINAQLVGEEIGKTITLDKVLLFSDGTNLKIGQPLVSGVKITAEVADEILGEKTIAYKYRRRKNWAWKKGHRQKLSSLLIKKIDAGK